MASDVVVLKHPHRGLHKSPHMKDQELEELDVLLLEIKTLRRIAEAIEAKIEIRVNRLYKHLQQGGQRVS